MILSLPNPIKSKAAYNRGVTYVDDASGRVSLVGECTVGFSPFILVIKREKKKYLRTESRDESCSPYSSRARALLTLSVRINLVNTASSIANALLALPKTECDHPNSYVICIYSLHL